MASEIEGRRSFYTKSTKRNVQGIINAVLSVDDYVRIPYVDKEHSIMAQHYIFIAMNVVEMRFRNTWHTPCADGELVTKCVVNCLEKKIYTLLDGVLCRLNFMQPYDYSPECPKSQRKFRLERIVENQLKLFDFEDTEHCSCPRKCKYVRYTYEEYDSFQNNDKDREFILQFPDNQIFTIIEEPAYTLFKLLSDIGGTIGLYFGLGVLQMLETLVTRLKSFYFWGCQKKKWYINYTDTYVKIGYTHEA